MNTNAYMHDYISNVTPKSCDDQCNRCLNLSRDTNYAVNNKACVDCTRCRTHITKSCASTNFPTPRDMFMDTRHSSIQYVPVPLAYKKKKKNKRVREVYEPNIGMCFMCNEDQMKCRRITHDSETRRLLFLSPTEERDVFDRFFVETADGVRNFQTTS